MASIHKAPDGRMRKVRWRERVRVNGRLEERNRSRTCPNYTVAKQLRLKIETAIALHGHYDTEPPPEVTTKPFLREALEMAMDEMARRLAPSSMKTYVAVMDIFLKFIDDPGATVDSFSRGTLLAFHTEKKRNVSEESARQYLKKMQAVWQALYDIPSMREHMLPPENIKVRAVAKRRDVKAPTWIESDRMLAQLKQPWRFLAAAISRYTGLRKGTVMEIRWQDVDLDQGMLYIAHDKSRVAQGRTVPISPHLVDLLSAQGRRLGYVVWEKNRECEQRILRQPAYRRAWKKAQVDDSTWAGHPIHCLRAGFATNLHAGGADPRAVNYLMGHKQPGQDDSYVAARAHKLSDAVALIPKIETSETLPLPFPFGATILPNRHPQTKGEHYAVTNR